MATISRPSNLEDQGRRKTLGRDLAEELGFPADTNLAKISQVELHGVSWNTDPYKRLLWRCIHNTLLKPFSSSRPGSPSPTASPRRSYDSEDECTAVPTNPPPSPAVGPVDKLSKVSVSVQEVPCDELDSCQLDDLDLDYDHDHDIYPSSLMNGAEDGVISAEQCGVVVGGESQLPAAGFLAAIRAEDGTLTWHFKDLS